MFEIGDIVYHSLYAKKFVVIKLYLQGIKYDRETKQDETMALCIALQKRNEIDYTFHQKHFILTGAWYAPLYKVGIHKGVKELFREKE